jgi:hypothetical protein
MLSALPAYRTLPIPCPNLLNSRRIFPKFTKKLTAASRHTPKSQLAKISKILEG